MKKLFYLCYEDFSNPTIIGIKNKVFSQIHSFQKNEIFVDYVFLSNNIVQSTVDSINNREIRHIVEINEICLSTIDNYDFIYIRFNRNSLSLISLLKRAKKHNIRVVIEIPTYPFKYEKQSFIKAAFRNRKIKDGCVLLERYLFTELFSFLLKNYTDRIITYSDDKKIYGIECINISNAIDLDKIPYSLSIPNENVLRIICVSACDIWHGYDRAIIGLAEYYKSSKAEQIELYIVGYGTQSAYYDELIKKYRLEKYVHLLGTKTGKELDTIFYKSHIALDALGRHRVGVYYNSSLKGKEYAARAMPIISGVKTEFDYYPDYKYYFRVSSDDKPLDYMEILRFWHSIKNDNYKPIIRKFAENHFSFENMFDKVLRYFLS